MSAQQLFENKYYLIPPYISGRIDWGINKISNINNSMCVNIENYVNTYGGINVSIASKLFVQLASGIGKLHSAGIIMAVLEMSDIYLDIPNKNIMGIYLNDPCAVIYDPLFINKGMVKNKRKMSIYSAPECIKDTNYDGFAADVYTLGIIFYKIVYGHFPESQSSVQNLEYCSKTNANIYALISLMLDTNPLVRPSLVNILNINWLNSFIKGSYVKIPHPCMTVPYFYCKTSSFNYSQQTHEIEANYSSAIISTSVNIEKTGTVYESFKKLKNDLFDTEKILIDNVYKYFELDETNEDIVLFRNIIDATKTQIYLISQLLSVKLKELKDARENIISARNYEMLSNWIVIFDRMNEKPINADSRMKSA